MTGLNLQDHTEVIVGTCDSQFSAPQQRMDLMEFFRYFMSKTMQHIHEMVCMYPRNLEWFIKYFCPKYLLIIRVEPTVESI